MIREEREVNNINSSLVNVITPMGIKWNDKDFMFGDNYCRVIGITTYPSRINAGWLKNIAILSDVTVSIHIMPTDSEDILDSIYNRIDYIERRLKKNIKDDQRSRWSQQLQDYKKVARSLKEFTDKVAHTVITILITDRTLQGLDQKVNEVLNELRNNNLRARTLMFRQNEAMLSTGPYGICSDCIKDMVGRNMLVSTIAASYPFHSRKIHKQKGFIMGNDVNREIVLIDTWETKEINLNNNWFIVGLHEKSYSIAAYVLKKEYIMGCNIIIIDETRYFEKACEEVGDNENYVLYNVGEKQYYQVIKDIWNQIIESGQRTILCVGFDMIKSEDFITIELLKSISMNIKRYDSALMFLASNINDFFHTSTHKFIANSSIHKLNQIKDEISLSSKEMKLLNREVIDSGLYVSGKDRIYLNLLDRGE